MCPTGLGIGVLLPSTFARRATDTFLFFRLRALSAFFRGSFFSIKASRTASIASPIDDRIENHLFRRPFRARAASAGERGTPKNSPSYMGGGSIWAAGGLCDAEGVPYFPLRNGPSDGGPNYRYCLIAKLQGQTRRAGEVSLEQL